MLEATWRHLAVSGQGGDVTEGIVPLLVPPDMRLVVYGRPSRRLVDAVGRNVTEVVRGDIRRPMAGSPSDVVVMDRASRRRAAAWPGAHVLTEEGRRRPEAKPDELVIEFRGDRVIGARPGGATPSTANGAAGAGNRWPTVVRTAARTVRRRLGSETSWAVLSVHGGDATRVPDQLCAAVGDAGYDVTGHRILIEDRRGFRTQKVLVRLVGPDGAPDAMAKVVRDPVDAHRIENEVTVLRRVAGIRGVADSVPAVLASGDIQGRPFLVQPFVAGRPLNDLLAADDPGARAAVESVVAWALDLGGHTSHRPVDGVGTALEAVVDRFVAQVRPPADVSDRLAHDAELISDPSAGLGLVVMHGDLGTWNVIVTDEGGVAVLDWEAGELEGLPMWDVFYLLRNACVFPNAQRPGALVQERLLDDLGWNTVLRRAVRLGVASTDTAPELVPSLFRLCWAHRALKEVTRLGVARHDRGYVDLALHMASLPDAYLRERLLDVE